MGAKKDSEQELVNSGENVVPADDEGKGISRRKFTRNALVGSAVLLTLGNRSAWGASSNTLMCLSTNLLVSYENGMASALNGTQQETDIENFITTRDNFDSKDSNSSVDRGISYRTGDVVEIVTERGAETCFEYKPK